MSVHSVRDARIATPPEVDIAFNRAAALATIGARRLHALRRRSERQGRQGYLYTATVGIGFPLHDSSQPCSQLPHEPRAGARRDIGWTTFAVVANHDMSGVLVMPRSYLDRT